MNQHSSIYYSPIYRRFKSFDENAYRAVVHFYEKNEDEISGLEFDEYFDFLVTYTNALFYSEEYRKHLLMADAVIETSFEHNEPFFQEEDILQKMLLQKATSHYHLMDFKKSVRILSELININPFDKNHVKLLQKCLWFDYPAYIQPVRGLAIASFLLSALVIALHLLVVKALLPDFDDQTAVFRNITLILGFGILIAGHGIHAFNVWRKSYFMRYKAKLKKDKTDHNR
jgi:hypothetical protein